MAYENYNGQSIGRILHFLYRYTVQADEAIFMGNGKITLFGAPFVDSITWDENDIPTFVFAGKYEHFNNVMVTENKQGYLDKNYEHFE